MTDQTTNPQRLDDVMLAMDVVDTLRHRTLIVEQELGVDAREEDMIRRLREIYTAQGIEVPDHILKDGVKALEENRFVYTPPKNTFSVKVAKFYIGRRRWLKPVAAILGIGAFSAGTYQFGVAGPADAAFNRASIALDATYEEANALAQTDYARARITAIHATGEDAETEEKLGNLQTSVSTLKQLRDDLEQSLTIRIISRPGEQSGVFRIPNDAPGTRNYYVLVEAVDAAGKIVPLEIASEEDQKTRRVKRWGVRVSEGEFNRIKADKQDDQIIQNAQIGNKPRGSLRPVYSIDTEGGAILDW